METEKAYILKNISIDDQIIVNEGVIPKKLINVTDSSNGSIESWVLTQRIQEERIKNVETAKEELLNLVKS
jgi:hypothetical protein